MPLFEFDDESSFLNPASPPLLHQQKTRHCKKKGVNSTASEHDGEKTSNETASSPWKDQKEKKTIAPHISTCTTDGVNANSLRDELIEEDLLHDLDGLTTSASSSSESLSDSSFSSSLSSHSSFRSRPVTRQPSCQPVVTLGSTQTSTVSEPRHPPIFQITCPPLAECSDGGKNDEEEAEEDVQFRIKRYLAPDTQEALADAQDPLFLSHIPHKIGLADFETLSVVGKGAFGKVFLVRKRDQGNLFAMKVLKKATITLHHHPRLSEGGEGIGPSVSNSKEDTLNPQTHITKEKQHTINERHILEEVRHPFIVKLYYAFQTHHKLYLILSYAPGGELFTYMAKERMFSQSVACFYAAELLLALQHLHSLGIIYRDLKPENVLLQANGHVMLTDFGLSKVALDTSTTCGTVEYMAPEVHDGKKKYNQSVDYWSLGILIYDMLTGNPPFSGNNRKKVVDNIIKKKIFFPKWLAFEAIDLIKKLLERTPSKRLGATDPAEVRRHPFFKPIAPHWNALDTLSSSAPVPPILPLLQTDLDTSNFLAQFTSIPIDSPPETPATALANADHFFGFSYAAIHDSLHHLLDQGHEEEGEDQDVGKNDQNVDEVHGKDDG